VLEPLSADPEALPVDTPVGLPDPPPLLAPETLPTGGDPLPPPVAPDEAGGVPPESVLEQAMIPPAVRNADRVIRKIVFMMTFLVWARGEGASMESPLA
jgi:hypothetical protein